MSLPPGLGPVAVLAIAACASAQTPPSRAVVPPCAAEADEQLRAVEGPVATPFTDPPELINREEIHTALESHFPVEKREEGGNWVTTVWLFVCEDGEVARLQLDETSGDERMDEAALDVARVMRFSPAKNRGRPVPVWISIPITFRTL